MNICGIISEYNPFHNGHALQINETRKLLSNDTVIVSVMSGNFVQRGDFAVTHKYNRAKSAVLSGFSDLVLELPLTYAVSSAETFALGGIEVLNSCGLISHISFGSESGEIEDLKKIAAFFLSDEFNQNVLKALKTGVSYASARQLVLNEAIPDLSSILESPNNTLGIEYIKALMNTNSSIMPITIKRIGASHDSCDIAHNITSASNIRRLIKDGYTDKTKSLVPEESYSLLHKNKHIFIEEFEQAILSYLRRLKPEDFLKLPDISEGLENRLYYAAYNAKNLDELYSLAKTKRYAMSRIRRAFLCAYLGITSDLQKIPLQFIRVLAANEKGRMVLKQMKKTCSVPIITKPIAEKKLTGDAKILSDLDVLADDLYFSPLSGGEHFKKTPYIE